VKKVFFIFGTRPETIKLAPVINEFKRFPDKYRIVVCITSQHKELLEQFLKLFEIEVQYNLNIMKDSQSLFDITTKVLSGIESILDREKPEIVFVQGDTTTSFAGALSGFYLKIPVAHIEAGLRTWNKYQPFPEEINRNLISVIADLHFAPTESAKTNLIENGINEEKIFVTGNTVVDALFSIDKVIGKENAGNRDETRIKKILLTAHRRESFGKPILNICKAVKSLAERNKNIEIIYPVHPNPQIMTPVSRELSGLERINLIEPVNYKEFISLMRSSYIILTDSGGLQEEAPSLGKPVLVLRTVTERPEAVEAGTVKVVGTDPAVIIQETEELLKNEQEYEKMSRAINPYGDGKASARIVEITERFFN